MNVNNWDQFQIVTSLFFRFLTGSKGICKQRYLSLNGSRYVYITLSDFLKSLFLELRWIQKKNMVHIYCLGGIFQFWVFLKWMDWLKYCGEYTELFFIFSFSQLAHVLVDVWMSFDLIKLRALYHFRPKFFLCCQVVYLWHSFCFAYFQNKVFLCTGDFCVPEWFLATGSCTSAKQKICT